MYVAPTIFSVSFLLLYAIQMGGCAYEMRCDQLWMT